MFEAPGEELMMNLTAAQIELIRDSFHSLEPDVAAAEMFYDRLFSIAPELRPMFRSDMTGQGMRFIRTLRVIVQNLDEPEALHPLLEMLAKGHKAYGVKPEHFRPMGQALIWTLRQTMGDAFPEGAEIAWEIAYDNLAQEMVALAE